MARAVRPGPVEGRTGAPASSRRRAAPGALAAAVAAAAAVALAGVARAEGLNIAAEPTYSHVETDVTDQAGRTTHRTTDALTQRYRLTLDRTLTNYLSAGVGATLLDERDWTGTDGVWSRGRDRATSIFGRLNLGTPVLSANLGVDRREEKRLTPSAPGVVVESFAANASWRPRDLPEIDLQARRTNTYDTAHRTRDATTDAASFGIRYNPRRYDLRYLLSWARTDDHLLETRTTSIEQTVLASRSDRLFGGRTTTHVSGTLQSRTTSAEFEEDGGTVTRQQLPFLGLSGVEAAPASATEIELDPNPLVVDGDTRTSASVNVGFGPSAGGDQDARDLGAQFADALTPVNQIHVWLDRALPDGVEAVLAASVAVYQSDDNQQWTPVSILGPPTPSALETRIEIAVVQTQARFLKVALRPLPVGLTTDPTFRDVFVTEVQFFLALPVETVPREETLTSAALRASARTLLLRAPDLTHDGSVAVARRSEDITTYTIVNGLSLAHRVTPTLATQARGARLDQDVGRGHEGTWQWNAALIGTPLPTARWNLTYSGRATDDGTVGHTLSAFGRADWYEGISTQANVAVSRTVREVENLALGFTDEQTTTAFQTSGRASLTPNPYLTLSAGGQYSRSLASSLLAGDVLTQFARVDATLSLTPAPALSATGTLARILLGSRPTTLGTMQLNYFPLRGDLQLAFAYSKTLDTEAEATTELFTPSLRWNLRRGVSLRSSYTFLESDAPAQLLSSRAFEATLLISL